MSDNIYTYEVNHGDKAPSVGAGTLVNDGELVAVSFTGQLSANQKAYEMIEDMIDNHFMEKETWDKLIEIQALL